MKIIQKKVSEILSYEHNSKLHPEWQVEQIAASIKLFGFNQPVLVDSENTIIAGHGRVLAAKKLDLEHIPAIVLDHLTEVQRKAFIIADNKLNLNTGFDEDVLKKELQKISELETDFNFFNIGFDIDEIDDILTDKDIEEIEGDVENDAIYEEKLKKHDDSNCKMPIVPDFFENHECFIIPIHNKIDEAFVRDLLNLNENHVSTSGDKKIRKTNVIDVEVLRCLVK